MKIPTFILLILTTLSTFVYGQTKEIEINGTLFSFTEVELDTVESAENKIVVLYRNGKKLLTHTLFKEEGDCSSIHIQLGKYLVEGHQIIFYSYWAATDRMPGSILPFGFRKQVYAVDSYGKLSLIEAKIYIENYLTTENKNYLEENGWKHKGLNYLNEITLNEYEQKLLADYLKNAAKAYHAEFVLHEEKALLEQEVRLVLKEEMLRYTNDWIDGGEVFGRVKK